MPENHKAGEEAPYTVQFHGPEDHATVAPAESKIAVTSGEQAIQKDDPMIIIDAVEKNDEQILNIRHEDFPTFGTQQLRSIGNSTRGSAKGKKQEVAPLVEPIDKKDPGDYGPDVVGVKSFLQQGGKNKIVSYTRLSETMNKTRTLQRRSHKRIIDPSLSNPTT